MSRRKTRLADAMAYLGEFTGKRARVVFSSDSKLTGRIGTIVQESRNVFKLLLLDNRQISIQKRGCVVEIITGNKPSLVDGRRLLFSSDMRTKRFKVKI